MSRNKAILTVYLRKRVRGGFIHVKHKSMTFGALEVLTDRFGGQDCINIYC